MLIVKFPFKTLGELASVKSGFAFKNRDWTDSGVPVVKIANIKPDGLDMDGCSFVRECTAQGASEFRLREGDILISMTGYVGQVTMVRASDLPAILNQRVGRFTIIDKGSLDACFLYYCVSDPSFREKVEAFGYGSAQKNVSPKAIHSIMVALPTLKEQDAIASLLRALDNKINLNRRTNETLEAMARALFKDWFVDFGPTRAKAEGCVPYLAPEIWELFPEALDDEDKPMGWMNSRLGDFVELVYGKALKADVRKLGSIPVYGSNGQVGWHNVNLADGPGVVVGRKGNPGTANYVIEDFFCIDTTFYTKPKSPHWTYSFLWLLMEQLNLPRFAADSAVPGLNREIAYSAECVAPKSEVAVAFSGTVEPLLTRIAHNEKESGTLAQLRDLLLPKLMSGEIRLREAEKAVEAVA